MSETGTPPRDYAALRALIAGKATELPRRLMQVAAFALENPDDIAFGTVASVAAAVEVPPSALVRFSRALGYQGFTELQEVFRSRLRERVPTYDERLARMREHGIPTSRAGLLLDGFLEASAQSIERFREGVDHDVIDRAVATLASARTVYLIGLRRSFPVASYMSYAMSQLGIRNMLVDAVAGMGAEQVSFITPEDAALVVSFAPYAAETVALTARAKARGARIVALSDAVFSPVAPPADVLIEIAEANFEGFRPMAATMALAMALCVALAGRREKSAG